MTSRPDAFKNNMMEIKTMLRSMMEFIDHMNNPKFREKRSELNLLLKVLKSGLTRVTNELLVEVNSAECVPLNKNALIPTATGGKDPSPRWSRGESTDSTRWSEGKSTKADRVPISTRKILL